MTSDRLRDLQYIESAVLTNRKNVGRDVRRQFWRLVREIKCAPSPDEEEVVVAARIRNILFVMDRGGTYPLVPFIALWFLIGSLVFLPAYLRMLQPALDFGSILVWTSSEWRIFAQRLGYMAAAAFFYYPLGRLAGGLLTGIKLEGVCRGKYWEPTLKIDYVTFLRAPASKRKWLFLCGGLATIVALIAMGVAGFILAGDMTGFIAGAALLTLEAFVIAGKTTKYIGGEMAHFNRERAIEKIWKERLASVGKGG